MTQLSSNSPSASSRWARPGSLLALAVLLMVAGVVSTWGAWSDIIRIVLKDQEASHVYLVPFCILWLLFVRRSHLAGYRPFPSLVGPLLVALGWVVGHYGFNHARQAPWHAGALLVVVGCMISVLGHGLLRRLWPVFLMLVFLIPVPGMLRQQIAIPLQTTSAIITQRLLQLVNVPVLRSGNSLTINGHAVSIIEACNGMRMVFPLLLVIYVFCFSLPLKGLVRLLLLLASPVATVACNVIRLIPAVYVYGHFSEKTAENFHDISAWLMIVVVFLLLMGVIELLQWMRIPVMQKSGISTPLQPTPARPASPGILALAGPVMAGLLILCMTSFDRLNIDWHEADGFHDRAKAAVAAMPRRIGTWNSIDIPIPPSAVALLRPNATLDRLYEDPVTGKQADFMLIECGDTRDMVGHYPPVCYPGQGWTITSATQQKWKARQMTVSGTEYELNRAEPSPNGTLAQNIIIRNFFVLPDGKMVADMEGVNAAAKNYRTLAYGVAQIQLLFFDTRLASWERDEIFATLVGANAPLFQALGSGGIHEF